MLYILVICLGIITGLLFKGKISNLMEAKVSKVWLILLAFVIQTFARIIGAKGIHLASESIVIIQVLVFLMLTAGFWLNRHYLGMSVCGLGYMMNALVMMANDGKMPVNLEVLSKTNISHFVDVIKSGADIKHAILDEGTRFGFLADIIPVPGFLGSMMQVISIGDLIIIFGIFILVVEFVAGRRIFDVILSKRNKSEGKCV